MQPHLKKLLPILLFAVLGLGLSAWIEVLHLRLGNDPSFTSFCNVNSRVDCDRVLTSRYADLAGISVSSWSILYYLTVLATAAALAAQARARLRESLALGILVLSGLGFLFSVYMAVIAVVVLQTICLMCSGLYLVSIGLLVSSWRLRTSQRVIGRRQKQAQGSADRVVALAGVSVAALLVAFVAYEIFAPGGAASTSEEIRTLRPEFYAWFYAQPIVELTPDARTVRGKADAPLTIVEFSDFQCGHCAKLHDSLEQVLRRDGTKVRIAFRHFPLDSSCNPKLTQRFHPDACLAAIAAECAAEQDRFWEYHSILFDHQGQLGREFLLRYAADLGLDKERFTTCLASDAPRLRVQRDVEEGQRIAIESTPTMFLNGRRIKGALEPDRLADALVLAAGK